MKNNLLKIMILIFVFSSCSSFKIENVSFGWTSEFFASPEKDGTFSITKNSIKMNVLKIFQEENKINVISDTKVRIIRDDEGYYYLTADGFKYIWVFCWEQSALKLYNKISFKESFPLDDPKFNESKPYITLMLKDGTKNLIFKEGLVEKKENK